MDESPRIFHADDCTLAHQEIWKQQYQPAWFPLELWQPLFHPDIRPEDKQMRSKHQIPPVPCIHNSLRLPFFDIIIYRQQKKKIPRQAEHDIKE